MAFHRIHFLANETPSSKSLNHFIITLPHCHITTPPHYEITTLSKFDLYIIKRFAGAFVFLLLAVIAIVLVVDFNEKSDTFLSDEGPPLADILQNYGYNVIPYFTNLLTPICVFLGVIFFTSRMAQRTEFIPLLSGGVSFYRILAPYIFLAVLIGLASFYLKSYVVPESVDRQLDFDYTWKFRHDNKSQTRYVHKKVSADGTFVSFDYYQPVRAQGTGFMMERKKGNDFTMRLKADRIKYIDSLGVWRLNRVEKRIFDGIDEKLVFVAEMDTTILLTPADLQVREMMGEAMTLPQLKEYIKMEEMRGSEILFDLYSEQHRRFADPIAVLILTLIGFAMSSRKTRGGIAVQIGIGLVLCFTYIALLYIGKAAVGDDFSPFWAVWTPNFIFFPLAIYLLRKAPK
jgi:lipopolysaccharide export system permease protein